MSFEEEKTFPPTKRKLKKEREKGNVWFSKEFASSIFLGLSFLFLLILFSLALFEKVFILIFDHLNSLTEESALSQAFSPILRPTLLFFMLTLLFALLGYLIQRGWIWKWKRQKWHFFKKKSGRWFFPLLKITLFLGVAYFILRSLTLESLPIFVNSSEKLQNLSKKIFILVGFLLLSYFLLGIGDLFYQRWSYFKKMRMSKKELRDEKREEETKKPNR